MANDEMETLSTVLKRAIRRGAPLYNEGNAKACMDLYAETAEQVLESPEIANSPIGGLLRKALEDVKELLGTEETKEDYREAAWILRRCFDEILQQERSSKKTKTVGAATNLTKTSSTISTASSDDEWIDEWTTKSTDFEKGQALADVAFILRASIQPRQHTRFVSTFNDCWQASEAVELLTILGLAPSRNEATRKCNRLHKGGLIRSISHPEESSFKDGTRLYGFSTRDQIAASLDEVTKLEKVSIEGSAEQLLMVALQATLETMDATASRRLSTDESSAPLVDDGTTTITGESAKRLQTRRDSELLPEEVRGKLLAAVAQQVQSNVDIADRTYRLKKYESCFVGKDAVTIMVEQNLASSRSEATQKLDALVQNGLIHHVTRDHSFKDAALFYRFTSASDLKNSLDAFTSLERRDSAGPKGDELVRYAALVTRYRQFADLDIPTILNDFYGCDDESGWDLVDLENWRLNMKRWGFGKPEDRDDPMIDRLAPKLLNIDPDTWDKAGDEEWESPWGIMAQIALFDQISRSAFRGTPEAFKWDELAKRATRVALEKGYFETAFKSTLNQFLLLLPLEHSESWEDQKLGVTLLLQLLSKVAVLDEGFTDFEVVKRLEFSKRLTTAFLEHAQVIAKFKRYPHRNRAQGRTTTLEERIWLASDLVPRWAKSQNPEDSRNIVNLPVIPLKRLTKR